MPIHQGIIRTAGRAPLSQLNRITSGAPAAIAPKAGFFNPLGSLKDRIGCASTGAGSRSTEAGRHMKQCILSANGCGLGATSAIPVPCLPQSQRTSLSAREIEILDLLAQGLSNKEIGARLNRSPFTVKNHLARIFEKLHVRCRTEAVMAFLRRATDFKIPIAAA
jgi:DNA-binding CsgD family transcriptional regulator